MLNFAAPSFRARSGRVVGTCCILFAGAATLVAAPPMAARADVFATVPSGDALYDHLAAISKEGWCGSQGRSASTKTSQLPLTRYEMALETAKAIFTINAHQRADNQWLHNAPRPALRALRALTLGLAGELKKLDVDARGTLDQLDALLRLPLGVTTSMPASTGTVASIGAATSTAPAPRASSTSDASAAPDAPAPRVVTPMAGDAAARIVLPLSQRLRLQTAFSALARESDDPFGDGATESLIYADSINRNGGGARLDAIYDVNNRLSLRAGVSRQGDALGTPRSIEEMAMRSSLMPYNTRAGRSFGGGLDLRVRPGLKLSGDVSRLSTDGANGSSAIRYGGGVGLSAWQNRLTLSANLSRLVPEERSMLLAQTATAFNLDVGMTDRLRLKLLYQQWFGAPAANGAQSMLAGGINLSF